MKVIVPSDYNVTYMCSMHIEYFSLHFNFKQYRATYFKIK